MIDNNSKQIRVYVGNHYEPETWLFQPGFRTEQQFEVVRQLVEATDFDFACCSKLFQPEGTKPYRGSFVFSFYTKDGKLNAQKITPTGRVTVKYST